ncbi:DNA replication complex GINS protein psf3 [Zancudomyces culisetae]|uniref:DNA replication complex GINS protein PSF3 n=2 Tax=Zancudomyces culisetae TaxID=1213189 RepID=A0A1R1PD90_ZANCU|nr:DNA replication complex GINS protein psf3 [Zancudomyces culisetae]OMH80512.1 DNA replication complex GINS protein psf3 [Zancudomyces culisetae]|eukprot:OMH78960.1 DNA replication complex GINS protein psf3 [Zancudomyces culisetae]
MNSRDYYDIDDILCVQQQVPCTTIQTLVGLSFDVHNNPSKHPQSQKLPLPFWLADPLDAEEYVRMSIPPCFSKTTQKRLLASIASSTPNSGAANSSTQASSSALLNSTGNPASTAHPSNFIFLDAEIANLRSISPFFYKFAERFVELSPNLSQFLSLIFLNRLQRLVLLSNTAAGAEMERGYVDYFDESERRLFASCVEYRNNYFSWLRGDKQHISASFLVKRYS